MAAPADHGPAAQQPVAVAVNLPINLSQFLKLAGIADTGGDAKWLIASGHVRVNGQAESRRGRQLVLGDVVETEGRGAAVLAVVECSSND